jgi:hypothetical protein
MTRSSEREGLVLLLRALKLPAFVDRFADLAKRAEKEGWGFEQYLYELAR